LIDKKIDYNDVVKKLAKINSNNSSVHKTFNVCLTQLENIVYSSPEFSVQNKDCRMNTIDKETDLEYAPIWQFNLDDKKLNVFAGYVTNIDEKDETMWNVIDMSENIVKL